MQCNGLACKLMASALRKDYSFSSRDAHANFKSFEGCIFLSKPRCSNRRVDNKRTRGLYSFVSYGKKIYMYLENDMQQDVAGVAAI